RLLEKAAERGLVVQIVVRMEDERTQHPLMQVAGVDLRPLPGVIAKVPKARIQISNAAFEPRDDTLLLLARSGNVFFDFANVERLGGLGRMIQRVGRERVVFGSHFPLFYPESALLKMQESAVKGEDAQAIQHTNARALLPRT